MTRLSADFSDRLLDILLEIPAFQNQDNRNMLLRHLPKGPVSAIQRNSAPLADLNNIVVAAEGWGRLTDSGEWALAIIARDALRFSKGTDLARKIDELLAELETLPSENDLQAIPEIVIGRDERLPVDFLEKGLIASKAVARVLVPRIISGMPQNQYGYGTGWLLTSDLLITNYHVIEARDRIYEEAATEADFRAQALQSVVWFDYTAVDKRHADYRCIELLHSDRKLDYALLRVSSTPVSESDPPLSAWGFLPLVPQSAPELTKEERLNIIQHPQGGPKRLAIRSNFYVDCLSTDSTPRRIRYLTDTEPGSSGSPVCNDNWQVVALHHAAVPVEKTIYKGETVKYNNQGIEIHAILDNLPDVFRQEIKTA